MDIAEFLTARLDAEEAAAREACDNDSGDWFMGRKWNVYRAEDETPQEDDETNRLVVEGNVKAQSEHIAYWNPSRVLADIAAKRAVIDLYRGERGLLASRGHNAEGESRVWLLEAVLVRLAAPYAEHADFDPAWTR